jgi:branched-chain amino acid transport system substrate-binding protein
MLKAARCATTIVATLVVAAAPYASRAEACQDLVLGAALSATGIYASNGNNTKNGYEFAVKKINDAGGVKVGDQWYHSRSSTTTTNRRQRVQRSLSSV